MFTEKFLTSDINNKNYKLVVWRLPAIAYGTNSDWLCVTQGAVNKALLSLTQQPNSWRRQPHCWSFQIIHTHTKDSFIRAISSSLHTRHTKKQQTQQTNIHAHSGIRTLDPRYWVAADPHVQTAMLRVINFNWTSSHITTLLLETWQLRSLSRNHSHFM